MSALISNRRLAFAWRFMLALLILTPLAARHGQTLVAMTLPLMKAELAWLDENYEVRQLQLKQTGGGSVVWVEVGQAHAIVIGERAFLPDPRGRATASTLVAHAMLAMVLIWCCALALPIQPIKPIKPMRPAQASSPDAALRFARLVAMRALAASIACLIALALDVPFTLWASIWSLHVDAVQPDRFSPLLIWQDVLGGGGRLAMGLALGLTAARLTSGRTTAASSA